MEATALRTTCAPTDCGENVPSKLTVTACPILRATPHSAKRPLAEMSTSVARKPGGEIRRPVIDGMADAGRRRGDTVVPAGLNLLQIDSEDILPELIKTQDLAKQLIK